MVFNYLKRLNHATENVEFIGEGVLDIIQDGDMVFYAQRITRIQASQMIFTSHLIKFKKFSLRTGDMVSGKVRPLKEGERYFHRIISNSYYGRRS